jgi:hypothetical protein
LFKAKTELIENQNRNSLPTKQTERNSQQEKKIYDGVLTGKKQKMSNQPGEGQMD